MENSVGEKEGKLSVSKIDFVGLDFGDKKKTRGLPPGLVPVTDSFSDGDLTEVEFIVGDATKFDAVTGPEPEQTKEEESELYKPTVSTWGVFPRPGNISKTVCFFSICQLIFILANLFMFSLSHLPHFLLVYLLGPHSVWRWKSYTSWRGSRD